jgi:Vacuolar protein 14 C-terminal Fig4p binding
MLEHHRHPYLLKSLYAILMVLPPSRAYKTLQLRLKDISSLNKSLPIKKEEDVKKIELISHEELKLYFIQANIFDKTLTKSKAIIKN